MVQSKVFSEKTKLEEMNFYYKSGWSLIFAILGFCVLVLKICINSISDINANKFTEVESNKIKLRYYSYYPIMISVLALLSTVISMNSFKLPKMEYFVASGLLAFFMGYFVDSLPDQIEKLSEKVSGK